MGRFAIKPVNDSRIAQISGKMLIARSNSIVGRMKSQATARSDSPRSRHCRRRRPEGHPSAMPLALFVTDHDLPACGPIESPRRVAPPGRVQRTNRRAVRRILAFLLEHLDPVLDQQVERLLRSALVGDDVIVDAVLHVEEERDVERLGPEILDHAHRLDRTTARRAALFLKRPDLSTAFDAEAPPRSVHFC